MKIPIPTIETSEELAEINKRCWTAIVLGLIYARLATYQKFTHETITEDIKEIWNDFQGYLESVEYKASPTKILLYGFRKCKKLIDGHVFGPDVADLGLEDSSMLGHWSISTNRSLILEYMSQEPTNEMMSMLRAYVTGRIERIAEEPDWRHFVVAHIEAVVGILDGTIPVKFDQEPKPKAVDPQLP